MIKEEYFEVKDDMVIKCKKVTEGEWCAISSIPVMDKKTFIECFEKWIKQND